MWDLYAQTSQWYERMRRRRRHAQAVRLNVLHQIEAGGNEAAEIAELVSTAVLRRHLETMERLDIEYDFLPRESEILQPAFLGCGVYAAEGQGRAVFETAGKNAGCWVMRRAGRGGGGRGRDAMKTRRSSCVRTER